MMQAGLAVFSAVLLHSSPTDLLLCKAAFGLPMSPQPAPAGGSYDHSKKILAGAVSRAAAR